jgi:hypothetical protein
LRINFKGGEKVEFGDEVIAASSLFVLSLFLFLILPFFEVSYALTVGWVLSVLISALIVGFMFAKKMAAARIKSSVDVVVLIIVVTAFFNLYMAGPDLQSLAIGAVVRGVFSFIGLYAGSMLRKPKKT